MLARVDPDGATDVAMELLASANPVVQSESLRILDKAPYGPKLGKAMVGAIRSAFPQVRARALAMLRARHERRSWDTVLETLKGLAAGDLSMVEAAFIGEALAELDPARALAVFTEWLRPATLVTRVQGLPLSLRWAAVSGLALVWDPQALELLQWLAARSTGELQQHCLAAINARATRARRGT